MITMHWLNFQIGAGSNYKVAHIIHLGLMEINQRVNSDMPNVAGSTDGDFRITGVQFSTR